MARAGPQGFILSVGVAQRSICATLSTMNPRKITQRELRNHSAEILRAVDHGEAFVITRHGIEVGVLMPVRQAR